MADYFFTNGELMELSGQKDEAVIQYQKAMDSNPYHFIAYQRLLSVYTKNQDIEKLNTLKHKVNSLSVKPGSRY